jgi:hypothetical protein
LVLFIKEKNRRREVPACRLALKLQRRSPDGQEDKVEEGVYPRDG